MSRSPMPTLHPRSLSTLTCLLALPLALFATRAMAESPSLETGPEATTKTTQSSASSTSSSSVQFADPSQPGTLKIYIAKGELHIRGVKEKGLISVSSTSSSSARPNKPREDGLRVLGDTKTTWSLKAQGNTAELNYGRDSWPSSGSADLDVTCPSNTTLEIQNGWGGKVLVQNIDGDISIKGLNCEVSLQNVSGGTSIETMNGGIDATFAKLPENKAVSMSSMNGEITVRIPADSKATLRLRTHNGAVLTDFPEDTLTSVSENQGSSNWGTLAGKQVVIAARLASEIGREVAENAKEMAREIHDSANESAAESPATPAAPPAPPSPPKPPRAPQLPNIPAISGGKVVSGTLNGGGSSVQITTMNGDITVRKNRISP